MKKRNEGWFYLLLFGVLAAGLGSSWYLYNLDNSALSQEVSELKPDQLAETVKQKEKILFAYFYTPDCAQCKSAEEMVANAAKEKGEKWVKVNVKNATDLQATYQIKGVPSLIVFQGGKEVSRLDKGWEENKVTALFQQK
ncbi:Thioredoxin [Marininema mesophilum]|uniref:Thioredoxin n=1 Tax=Marininema mesophilum TaxID=1048340 RepID=A0A1H2ZLJ2_9BACL|nr:thioredoxin family protein [Marininema mesophilum]SDX18237.1 Thioredoxin [Marininema mesophilum]